MQVRADARGLVYVGKDPTGVQVIRIALGDMTEEQLRGWLMVAPATALRYLDPNPKRKQQPTKKDGSAAKAKAEQPKEATDSAEPAG